MPTRKFRSALRRLGSALTMVTVALAGAAAIASTPDLPEVADTQTQLALDLTPVPSGMGAIFVPSATRPELEPQVHIYAGDERVATAAIGRRIAVPPGRYTVIVGQGPMPWRPRTEIEVEAGQTTVTPDFFATLRVLAIDPYESSYRAKI